MSLAGSKIDTTVTPATLTVISDKRKISAVVTTAGENVTLTGLFPVTIVDASGKVWVVKSDDGLTAVYS